MIMLVFLVCLLSSLVGAICGIGGGIIIKPVLDALGIMDVAAISFLSGFTVLVMSAYSILQCKFSGTSHIDKRIGNPLALGAVVGGILGKVFFSYITKFYGNLNKVGMVQAFCLLLVTLGTLVYSLYKDKIKTKSVNSVFVAFVIGASLGMISSFLGIGGGPMNLVVLYYFFSMSVRAAVENSLNIIMYSQIASLILTLMTKAPNFDLRFFVVMALGGLLGGMSGRKINKRIKDYHVNKLFIFLLILMIAINLYNMYKFGRSFI